MKRIREGWWLMLVLCVGCGLWFFALPLLGYGFVIDGIWLRPGWMGVPPCVFGAVYAARCTGFHKLGAVATGSLLFAATFALGLQFSVMRASHIVPCEVLQEESSCLAVRHFEQRHDDWSPLTAARNVRSPFSSRTFVERVR